MRGIIFIVLAVLLFCSGCETAGGWGLSHESKIGIQMTDKKGNSGFCEYDVKATPETFEQELTCGMDLIIGNKIIRCEKLRVGHVYKDFETEANCKVIFESKEAGPEGP